MKVISVDEIPNRATIVDQFTKCGRANCTKLHGPYKYAYWKENGRLKKVYIGKSFGDLKRRLCYEQIGTMNEMSFSHARKQRFIIAHASQGDPIAIQYWEKIQRNECGTDWAFRRLGEHLHAFYAGAIVKDSLKGTTDT